MKRQRHKPNAQQDRQSDADKHREGDMRTGVKNLEAKDKGERRHRGDQNAGAEPKESSGLLRALFRAFFAGFISHNCKISPLSLPHIVPKTGL